MHLRNKNIPSPVLSPVKVKAEAVDDKNEATDIEEGWDGEVCYCEKNKTSVIGTDEMIHCHKCLRWFHHGCLISPPKLLVYGDPFILFNCKNCSDTSEEIYERLSTTWIGTTAFVLYHLVAERRLKMATNPEEPQHLFFQHKKICDYLDENWDTFGVGKTKTITWQNTIASVLSTSKLFVSGTETLGISGKNNNIIYLTPSGYWSIKDNVTSEDIRTKKSERKAPGNNMSSNNSNHASADSNNNMSDKPNETVPRKRRRRKKSTIIRYIHEDEAHEKLIAFNPANDYRLNNGSDNALLADNTEGRPENQVANKRKSSPSNVVDTGSNVKRPGRPRKTVDKNVVSVIQLEENNNSPSKSLISIWELPSGYNLISKGKGRMYRKYLSSINSTCDDELSKEINNLYFDHFEKSNFSSNFPTEDTSPFMHSKLASIQDPVPDYLDVTEDDVPQKPTGINLIISESKNLDEDPIHSQGTKNRDLSSVKNPFTATSFQKNDQPSTIKEHIMPGIIHQVKNRSVSLIEEIPIPLSQNESVTESSTKTQDFYQTNNNTIDDTFINSELKNPTTTKFNLEASSDSLESLKKLRDTIFTSFNLVSGLPEKKVIPINYNQELQLYRFLQHIPNPNPAARRLLRKLDLKKRKEALKIPLFNMDQCIQEYMLKKNRENIYHSYKEILKDLPDRGIENQTIVDSEDLKLLNGSDIPESIAPSKLTEIRDIKESTSVNSTLPIDDSDGSQNEVIELRATSWENSFASRLYGNINENKTFAPHLQRRISSYHGLTLKSLLWRIEALPLSHWPLKIQLNEEINSYIRNLRTNDQNKVNCTPSSALASCVKFKKSDVNSQSSCITEAKLPHPLDFCYFEPGLLSQVNQLLSQLFWDGIDMTEALQYPEYSVVATYRHLVIGCAFMTPSHYITYFGVAPGWQKCSIGKYMLYLLLQAAQGRDVTLHVSPKNPALILYQKFGFKSEQFIVNFYDKYLIPTEHFDRNAMFLRLRG